MKVAYRSSLEDEVETNLRFLQHANKQGKSGWTGGVVGWFVLLGILLPLVLLLEGGMAWIPVAAFAVAGAILVNRYVSPALIRNNLRRILRLQRGDEWVACVTELHDTGITTENTLVSLTLPWHTFQQMDQTEDQLFLLFTGGITSIPTRVFQPGELDAFIARVRELAERHSEPPPEPPADAPSGLIMESP